MSASISAMSDLHRPDHIAGSGATRDAYELTRRRAIIFEGDWDQWLNSLTSKLEQEERYFDIIKYREGISNALFYEGNFFFRYSEDTGEVRDLPHTDVDPFFPHNWFRYFTDLSVAAAMEASPDIIIDPTRNEEKNIYAARAGRQLGEYLERELITEEFRLETEKTRQLYGGVWWYSYWSLDAHKLFVPRPEFEQMMIPQEGGSFMCGCGEMGDINNLQQTMLGALCPGCMRRDQMHIMNAPEALVDVITGYKEENLGFPCVECVSPLQMKGDRRSHYMKGQYVRRKRLVDRDVVANAIHWWDEKYGGGGSDDDPGIKAEEVVRRPHSSSSSLSSIGSYDRDRNDVVVEQWWFQPAKYARVEFDRDVEFIGEKVTKIPAHTPLGEVFPKGLHALKVGGHWLDHREEDFRKRWVYIPYISIPNKSDGDSLKDMREPQREIIHMRSLLYLYLLARGGGGPTIIKPPLSETDFDGSPATITRLSSGYQGSLQDLFFQPQFPPADPNLSNYVNQMTGEMQIMSQTVSPSSTGDPGSQQMGGINTARGMMIMNAKAQGLQGPKLMPLAFGQAQAVMQWIDLVRENIPDEEIPIPLKGKTGTPEWAMLKTSELEGDMFAYPRPGSWIPRPREEKQASLQNCFTVFGEVLLNPDAPADMKREIKEAYGLEFDLDDYDTEVRDAVLRVELMKKYIPYAMQDTEQIFQQGIIPPDPQTGQPLDPTQIAGQLLSQMCPIDEDLDQPPVYLTYFRTWLRSDEGKDAHPVHQSAIRQQWKRYKSMMEQEEQQQMQQMQDMQDQQNSSQKDQEAQKLQSQSQFEQQRHGNKLQEQQQQNQHDEKRRGQDTDNRIKEHIAKAALDAATAEGQELPTSGHQQVPKLSDLPSQPLF